MKMAFSGPIIVTGVSSGIGLAVAQRLLAADCSVIGIARRAAAAIEHPHYRGWNTDLADVAAVERVGERIATDAPDIAGLVACAGAGQFGSLEEFSPEQIRQRVDLNLTSNLVLCRYLVPLLKRQDRGDLVFIGSESALSGGRYGAVYCATKFGLRGFAQALREECSRRRIRVTVINPGMVLTPFFDQLHFAPGDDPANYVTAENVADAVELVLLSRRETVFDEINLSPLKKSIQFRKRD